MKDTKICRAGLLRTWHDRQIFPGEEWSGVIDEHLRSSELILLLISPDFIASEYCWDVEMAMALDAHNRGTAVMVPIYVRPTDLSLTPFEAIQGLPRDAKPISSWKSEDEPLSQIASEIRRLAEVIVERRGGPRSPSNVQLSESAQDSGDAQRIKAYHRAFLRPAFSTPCIFEDSLTSLLSATDQLTEALSTGKVRRAKTSRVDYRIPSISEFESSLYYDALVQVSGFINAVKRNARLLMSLLKFNDQTTTDETYFIMEFELEKLSRSREEMSKALSLMDRIDSERNAIVSILNALFEKSGVPKIPEISRSSDLVYASATLEKLGLEYLWDLYYVRTHRMILETILEEPELYYSADVSDEDKNLLLKHISSVIGFNSVSDEGGGDQDLSDEEESEFLSRLKVAIAWPEWRGKPDPKLEKRLEKALHTG